MNKENFSRSKIPIPMDPLPPLSEKFSAYCNKGNRRPLQIIYKEPVNLETAVSNNVVKVNAAKKIIKRRVLRKVDDRHVTIRPKAEVLDWEYKVFNDSEQGSSIIERHKNIFGENSKTSTPKCQSSLESSAVKNKKRSLKRPHSRELQRVSPNVTNDIDDQKCKRQLDFDIRFEYLSPNTSPNSVDACLKEYSADIVHYFLKKEVIQESPKISTAARACVLSWLMKVNGSGGLPVVVATAAWFFDAMLADDGVPVEKLQELAAACYWLSLKHHGRVISAKRLVKASSNAFTIECLRSTERWVLTKLKFPVLPVLPNDFISYMCWVCNPSNYEDIELAATIIYMANLIMNKINALLLPSALGVAAVKNALLLLDKTDLLATLKRNEVYKIVTKKTNNFAVICAFQRDNFRTMTASRHEYKTVLQNYKDFISIKIDKRTHTFY